MENSAAHLEAYNCVTCGNIFQGQYCNQCGERKLTAKDRSMLHFLGEFFHMLTHADSKFLKSLKYLFTRPGFLTSEYLVGRRKIYTIPLSLFLIANLLYFLIPSVDALNSTYTEQTMGQPYSAGVVNPANKKMHERNWTEKEMEERYNHESGKVAKMMLIVAVYLFSVPVSLVFFSRKNYYFNHLAFSLEAFNFIIYFVLLAIPLLFMGGFLLARKILGPMQFPDISSAPFLLFLMVLLWTYFILAAKRVYRQSWLITIGKSLLLTASVGCVVILYRWILFYVTLALL